MLFCASELHVARMYAAEYVHLVCQLQCNMTAVSSVMLVQCVCIKACRMAMMTDHLAGAPAMRGLRDHKCIGQAAAAKIEERSKTRYIQWNTGSAAGNVNGICNPRRKANKSSSSQIAALHYLVIAYNSEYQLLVSSQTMFVSR